MRAKELFRENVFTVSNLLTSLRIITVPLVGYFMYLEFYSGNIAFRRYQLYGLMFIITTDFFDGYLARLLKQESALGQFLDPFADKFTSIFLGTFLCMYKGFPWVIFFIALGREVFVLAMSGFLFYRRNLQVKPNIFGKIAMTFIAAAALIYSQDINIAWQGVSLKHFTIGLVFLFYILGGIVYTNTYKEIYFEKS